MGASSKALRATWAEARSLQRRVAGRMDLAPLLADFGYSKMLCLHQIIWKRGLDADGMKLFRIDI